MGYWRENQGGNVDSVTGAFEKIRGNVDSVTGTFEKIRGNVGSISGSCDKIPANFVTSACHIVIIVDDVGPVVCKKY